MRRSRLPISHCLALTLLASCVTQSTTGSQLPTATQTLAQVEPSIKWQEPAWLRNFPEGSRETLSFDHLSLQDGLSQSVVLSMAQDPRGFLWLGTQDGLNRFDGYDFRIYKHDLEDPHSLIDNLVTAMIVDPAVSYTHLTLPTTPYV